VTYTTEQVQEAVSAFDAKGWGEFYQEMLWSSEKHPIHLDLLDEDAFFVDRVGGSEGDGEHMEVVFRIGDQLFRKVGYYNSWDSNDWDTGYGLDEVEPYEVTVTRYREKR